MLIWLLPDIEWTKEETDYLFKLVRDFDLRWYIIHDRYDYSPGPLRTLEVWAISFQNPSDIEFLYRILKTDITVCVASWYVIVPGRVTKLAKQCYCQVSNLTKVGRFLRFDSFSAASSDQNVSLHVKNTLQVLRIEPRNNFWKRKRFTSKSRSLNRMKGDSRGNAKIFYGYSQVLTPVFLTSQKMILLLLVNSLPLIPKLKRRRVALIRNLRWRHQH